MEPNSPLSSSTSSSSAQKDRIKFPFLRKRSRREPSALYRKSKSFQKPRKNESNNSEVIDQIDLTIHAILSDMISNLELREDNMKIVKGHCNNSYSLRQDSQRDQKGTTNNNNNNNNNEFHSKRKSMNKEGPSSLRVLTPLSNITDAEYGGVIIPEHMKPFILDSIPLQTKEVENYVAGLTPHSVFSRETDTDMQILEQSEKNETLVFQAKECIDKSEQEKYNLFEGDEELVKTYSQLNYLKTYLENDHFHATDSFLEFLNQEGVCELILSFILQIDTKQYMAYHDRYTFSESASSQNRGAYGYGLWYQSKSRMYRMMCKLNKIEWYLKKKKENLENIKMHGEKKKSDGYNQNTRKPKIDERDADIFVDINEKNHDFLDSPHLHRPRPTKGDNLSKDEMRKLKLSYHAMTLLMIREEEQEQEETFTFDKHSLQPSTDKSVSLDKKDSCLAEMYHRYGQYYWNLNKELLRKGKKKDSTGHLSSQSCLTLDTIPLPPQYKHLLPFATPKFRPRPLELSASSSQLCALNGNYTNKKGYKAYKSEEKDGTDKHNKFLSSNNIGPIWKDGRADSSWSKICSSSNFSILPIYSVNIPSKNTLSSRDKMEYSADIVDDCPLDKENCNFSNELIIDLNLERREFLSAYNMKQQVLKPKNRKDGSSPLKTDNSRKTNPLSELASLSHQNYNPNLSTSIPRLYGEKIKEESDLTGKENKFNLTRQYCSDLPIDEGKVDTPFLQIDPYMEEDFKSGRAHCEVSTNLSKCFTRQSYSNFSSFRGLNGREDPVDSSSPYNYEEAFLSSNMPLIIEILLELFQPYSQGCLYHGCTLLNNFLQYYSKTVYHVLIGTYIPQVYSKEQISNAEISLYYSSRNLFSMFDLIQYTPMADFLINLLTLPFNNEGKVSDTSSINPAQSDSLLKMVDQINNSNSHIKTMDTRSTDINCGIDEIGNQNVNIAGEDNDDQGVKENKSEEKGSKEAKKSDALTQVKQALQNDLGIIFQDAYLVAASLTTENIDNNNNSLATEQFNKVLIEAWNSCLSSKSQENSLSNLLQKRNFISPLDKDKVIKSWQELNLIPRILEYIKHPPRVAIQSTSKQSLYDKEIKANLIHGKGHPENVACMCYLIWEIADRIGYDHTAMSLFHSNLSSQSLTSLSIADENDTMQMGLSKNVLENGKETIDQTHEKAYEIPSAKSSHFDLIHFVQQLFIVAFSPPEKVFDSIQEGNVKSVKESKTIPPSMIQRYECLSLARRFIFSLLPMEGKEVPLPLHEYLNQSMQNSVKQKEGNLNSSGPKKLHVEEASIGGQEWTNEESNITPKGDRASYNVEEKEAGNPFEEIRNISTLSQNRDFHERHDNITLEMNPNTSEFLQEGMFDDTEWLMGCTTNDQNLNEDNTTKIYKQSTQKNMKSRPAIVPYPFTVLPNYFSLYFKNSAISTFFTESFVNKTLLPAIVNPDVYIRKPKFPPPPLHQEENWIKTMLMHPQSSTLSSGESAKEYEDQLKVLQKAVSLLHVTKHSSYSIAQPFTMLRLEAMNLLVDILEYDALKKSDNQTRSSRASNSEIEVKKHGRENEELNETEIEVKDVNHGIQKGSTTAPRKRLIGSIPLFYWQILIDWFLDRLDEDDCVKDGQDEIRIKDESSYQDSPDYVCSQSSFQESALCTEFKASRYRHNNLYHNLFYKLILIILESGEFQTLYNILEKGNMLQRMVDLLLFSIQSSNKVTRLSQIGFVWKVANLIRVLSEKMNEIQSIENKRYGRTSSEKQRSDDENVKGQMFLSDESLSIWSETSQLSMLLKYLNHHSMWQKVLPIIYEVTKTSYLNPGFGLKIKKHESKFPTFIFCVSPGDSYALSPDEDDEEIKENINNIDESQNNLLGGNGITLDKKIDDEGICSIWKEKLGWNSEYAETALYLNQKRKDNILLELELCRIKL